jgi:ribonucleoside-diphosphate reductase alpha chain
MREATSKLKIRRSPSFRIGPTLSRRDMQVIKRDGSKEDVKIEKILHAVNKACRGLNNVEALEVAKRTISGLHDGSTTQELDNLSISNAVMLMSDEPNYSKVAARMLAESIRKEVGRDTAFRDYIKTAFEVGLLNSNVLELASQDVSAVEYAIRHERDDLFEYFGLKTLGDRYLLRHPHTRKLIERPQWLFMRVALGLSQDVPEALELYEIMSQFFYLAATPTLFNSGTRHQQMSSCFLLTVGEDSLEGIYKSITDCARLSKFSGGIGIDWTSVRSSGALIKGTNGLSNGIIPFLKVLDSSVHAVNQGGKRKGAAAIYLEPWHPDIESFLDLRNSTGSEDRRTHNLNLALWIPDLFMKRVESDGLWSLFCPSEAPDLINCFGEEFEQRYEAYESAGKQRKQVSARTLYARMMQVLAETGNGWICFKDKANQRSAQTGRPGNVIHSSNLCTEILEVTSASQTAVCNLGSINLSQFVTSSGSFDFEKLESTVRTAVKFLDRVIETNFYPTAEAKASNEKWRPIGLGIMGLQDTLFKLRLPFGSPEAQELSAKISEHIYYHALKASSELAEKKGAFENFKDSRYADGELQVQLAKKHQSRAPKLHFDWEKLAREIQTKGIRNSLLIAIAPTATIASIQGVYESIEPQVSNFFKRETLSGEFLQVNKYLIEDLKRAGLWNSEIREKIISADGSVQNIPQIPDEIKNLYRTAWEISQKELIDMAVDRSAFICQSQSLNLFIEDPNVGKLSSMYMYAWKSGVKTTYYLRSRAKTGIKKTTVSAKAAETETAAVSCSLENPENCEACQ